MNRYEKVKCKVIKTNQRITHKPWNILETFSALLSLLSENGFCTCFVRQTIHPASVERGKDFSHVPIQFQSGISIILFHSPHLCTCTII